MPVYPDPDDGAVIVAKDLHAWTDALVRRVGTPPDIAADVAEILLASDLRGIASHGTARLPQYLKLVEAGVMGDVLPRSYFTCPPPFASFTAPQRLISSDGPSSL